MNMNRSLWMILVAIAMGNLLVGLDRTVVSLAVPRMMADFHASASLISWVATSYLITLSIFIPVFGKLSDLYGARRVYILGFTGFAITSVFAGFSWNIGSLIFFRAIQGLFGASVYPTAIALIAENFRDREARAEALGLQTSILAGSLVLGPLVGGLLVDAFSWPSVFFINAPVGIIALFMAGKYLPKNEHVPVSKPFDYPGAIAFSLALVGIILVLERGSEWGWTALPTIVFFAIAALSSALFVQVERRDAHPFISFSLLENGVLRAALFVALVSYGVLYGFLFLFALYLQEVLRLGASQNGLFLAPLLVALTIASPLGGKMLKRHKPHVPVTIGLLLSTFGIGIIALSSSVNFVLLIIALGLMGAGIGLTSAPLSMAVTTAVVHELVGFASGLLVLIRNIGGIFFIAAFSVLLTAHVPYQALFALCAIIALGTLWPTLVLRRASV